MTETRGPYVGRPMKRVEDPRLIRGIATYVDDIRLPGTLHAAFVRSPYAHATITRINLDAARAAAGRRRRVHRRRREPGVRRRAVRRGRSRI